MKEARITKNSTEREIKEYIQSLCKQYLDGSLELEDLSQKAGAVMYSVFYPKDLIKKVSGEFFDFVDMLDEHYYYKNEYLKLKKQFQHLKV